MGEASQARYAFPPMDSVKRRLRNGSGSKLHCGPQNMASPLYMRLLERAAEDVPPVQWLGGG